MQVGLNIAEQNLPPFVDRGRGQRDLNIEDYQQNINRWKNLSRYQSVHSKLKGISAIATGCFLGCVSVASVWLCLKVGSALIASAVVLTATSMLVGVIIGIAGMIFTLFLPRIFKFDNTEYSKPHIASQTSMTLATCSLGHFHLYHSNKLNNLVRYGFINKEVCNRIKIFLKEKITLEKFIGANQHLINLPPQIRNQPEIQTATEQYNGYRDQLRELEQEYIDFRDNVMAPQLPFPSSWRFER